MHHQLQEKATPVKASGVSVLLRVQKKQVSLGHRNFSESEIPDFTGVEDSIR